MLNRMSKMSTESSLKDLQKLTNVFSSAKGGLEDYPEIFTGFLLLKEASSMANYQLGLIDKFKADAITEACSQIRKNKNWQKRLPVLRSWGEPINVEINEIISLTANENHPSADIRPYEINLNQSSADLLASLRVLILKKSLREVKLSVDKFVIGLERKAKEFSDAIKPSRIGMKDGLPTTVGKELQCYADNLRKYAKNASEFADSLTAISLGGGESATSVPVYPGFGELATANLSLLIGMPLRSEADNLAALNNRESVLAAHAYLDVLASIVWRLAKDLIIMNSGPRCGIHEVSFPACAPGSSIMPGKVNPTIAEMVLLVCDQISSNQTSISSSCRSGWLSTGGNTTIPIKNFLDSCHLLCNSLEVFMEKAINKLKVQKEEAYKHAEQSLMLAKVLAFFTGREKAIEAAEVAFRDNLSIREAAVVLGLLSEKEANRILDPKNLVEKEKFAALLMSHCSSTV